MSSTAQASSPEARSTAPGETSTSPAPVATSLRWQWTAALTIGTAGALHLAAAAEHIAAGQLAVGFFVLTAFAQFGFAAWLVVSGWAGAAPAREQVALALIGTVSLIGLYLLAQTSDVLNAFALPHDAGAGHGSGGGTHAGGSPGASIQVDGPVALDDEPVRVQHAAGPLGTATVAAEVLAVAALAALLPAAWRRRAVNTLFSLGALVWALWLTGVLA